ncbi:hypothetical protein RUM44_005357 [Polyplax serrata]|uniref:Uncharacterized protein n=1 Tax=Polyplax serrata TaxID=468196 RepID=A0ABR1ADB5_POLSC
MLNIWLGLAVFADDSRNCTLNGASLATKDPYKDICNSVELENLFKTNACFALCSFVVCILMFVVDRIPRKMILMFSSIASGVSSVVFAFVHVNTVRTVLAYVLLSFIYMAEIVFRIILFESYPTVLRSTAYGFIKIFSKIVLTTMIFLLKIDCVWAFTIFGCLFVCVGCLSYLLRNLNLNAMED